MKIETRAGPCGPSDRPSTTFERNPDGAYPRGYRTPQNLLRLSIGLEHSDDLIADLDQALSTIPA